jgi:hypothetical protein
MGHTNMYDQFIEFVPSNRTVFCVDRRTYATATANALARDAVKW